MNNFILYKVTCLINNKLYFGITEYGLIDRKAKHMWSINSGSKVKFHAAIRKYGKDNFIWEVLLENLSKQEAIKEEKSYIQKYDTFKKGYNSTLGGEGAFGYKWDKEHKRKVHEKVNREVFQTEEYKKKKSQITLNSMKKSDYVMQNNKKLLEFNKIHGNPRKGKKVSKEVLIKINITNKVKEFVVFHIESQKYIGKWLIRSECAKILGIANGKISTVLKGKRNQTKGYVFKYIDDPTVNGEQFNPIWLESIKRKT